VYQSPSPGPSFCTTPYANAGEFPYPTPHPPLSHRNPQQMPPHVHFPYMQASPMIGGPPTDDFRGSYNIQASHVFPIQHNTQVSVIPYPTRAKPVYDPPWLSPRRYKDYRLIWWTPCNHVVSPPHLSRAESSTPRRHARRRRRNASVRGIASSQTVHHHSSVNKIDGGTSCLIFHTGSIVRIPAARGRATGPVLSRGTGPPIRVIRPVARIQAMTNS